MREMYGDDGEYERERMYESAGLDVFLRSRYDSDGCGPMTSAP